MSYINNKSGASYKLIATGLDCNNDKNNDLTVLYTYNTGFLIKIRLFIISLLLPNDLFVRNYIEFNQKFTKAEKVIFLHWK